MEKFESGMRVVLKPWAELEPIRYNSPCITPGMWEDLQDEIVIGRVLNRNGFRGVCLATGLSGEEWTIASWMCDEVIEDSDFENFFEQNIMK